MTNLNRMTSVAISPKFQIVIPKSVRQALKLRPGQRVEVSLDGQGRLLVEPEPDVLALRGFLPPLPDIDVAEISNDPEELS